MDILSDVLRAVRLEGTAYFQADFAAPWGMKFGDSHVSNFHIVTGGRAGSDMPLWRVRSS
ncbi:MAG: hypothetical protein ACJAYU_000204 [Bradymonadia bacterium]|jgi:hypothetical protein